MVPTLTTNGQERAAHTLSLQAVLGGESRTEVQFWKPIPGLKKGQQLELRLGDSQFAFVVQRFRQPVGGSGLCWVAAVDPITAAPRFACESFSKPDAETKFIDALAARFPVGGKGAASAGQFPAVLLSNVPPADVLREIAARNPGWVYRYHRGSVELGPPPSNATEVDGFEFVETESGIEFVTPRHVPTPGDLIHSGDHEGHVVSMSVGYAAPSEPAIRLVIGKPGTPARSSRIRGMWIPAKVRKVSPLFLDAIAPDGSAIATRAELYGIRAAGEKCRVAVPLAVGDPVLLAWPDGIFTGTPIAIPFGPVPPAGRFEITADGVTIQCKDWQHTGDSLDYTVSKLFAIHR